MLRITEEHENDLHYVVMEGRLDGKQSDAATLQLEKIQKEQVDSRVVLDLEKLEYISSAGLRVLLIAAKQAKANGVEFMLCSPTREVKEVLDISGFGSIMSIVSCRDET
jgi:anti-anti-sigma factor